MPKTSFFSPFLLLILFACAAPAPTAGAVTPPTKTSQPTTPARPAALTPTRIPAAATRTSAPSLTPMLFSTATPGPSATSPFVLALARGANPLECYQGPNVLFQPRTSFSAASVIGRNVGGEWWLVRVNTGQGNFIDCWVERENVEITGNSSAVAVAEAPNARVIEVRIVPGSGGNIQKINCHAGARQVIFHFVGWIKANGPLDSLTYRWETSAPARFTSQPTQIAAWNQPQQIELSLSVPASPTVYSLLLRTTAPNEVISAARFEVQCQ